MHKVVIEITNESYWKALCGVSALLGQSVGNIISESSEGRISNLCKHTVNDKIVQEIVGRNPELDVPFQDIKRYIKEMK